jgi:hypothetical protein
MPIPLSSDDGASFTALPAIEQCGPLTQVIASSTTGDAWLCYTASPTAIVEELRQGILPAGASTPLLVTVAPLDLAGASDEELVRVGAWVGHGWIAAADLRAAGVRLLDVRVQVRANRQARRAGRRREARGA